MAHSRIPLLHAVKSLGLGGTEKVMQLLVQTLAHIPAAKGRKGFAPAVWSMQDGPRGELLRQSGIAVYIGDNIETAVRAHRPAIIHVHRAGWPEPDLMRPIHALRRHAPHTLPSALLPVVVETNVFGRQDASPSGRLVDSTLFVSHFCATRYAHLYDVPIMPPRRLVLYNPVDTLFLRTHTTAPALRDYSRPSIGRLARADSGKWSHRALAFLPALTAEFPTLTYHMVGAVDEAHAFVARHNLEAHVRFVPPLCSEHQLAAFMNDLSVLAHANDTGESFGMAIAEAMACGLPVVTHPCLAPRDNAQTELVEHGVTGIVANTEDDYTEALAHLLRHPDQARRMGEAAQHKAHACFAKETIARQLMELYETLLPAPTPPEKNKGAHHG